MNTLPWFCGLCSLAHPMSPSRVITPLGFLKVERRGSSCFLGNSPCCQLCGPSKETFIGSTHRAGVSQCLASLSHIIYKVHTQAMQSCYIYMCVYVYVFIYPPNLKMFQGSLQFGMGPCVRYSWWFFFFFFDKSSLDLVGAAFVICLMSNLGICPFIKCMPSCSWRKGHFSPPLPLRRGYHFREASWVVQELWLPYEGIKHHSFSTVFAFQFPRI